MAVHAPVERLEEQVRVDVANGNGRQLGSRLAHLHPADLALLLGRLDAATRLAVVRALEPALVGSALSKAGVGVICAVLPALATDEATAVLNALPRDRADRGLADVYVLHPDLTLAGVVSLAAVVGAVPTAPIAGLAAPPLATVTPATDREELARLVSQYDLATVPVVDEAGRMLGIVTSG